MSGDVHALVRRFNAAPPGKLYCIHGGSEVFRLSLNAVSVSLLRGVPVALVDGTNRFDMYAIANFARRLAARGGGSAPTPEQLLDRVFISRAFTCYQMEAVITERLPRFLARERIPVAVVFGLLDTLYDEQAPLFDVRAGLDRMLESLRRLRRANIGVLLASQDTVPAAARRSLFPRLAAGMDGVFAAPPAPRHDSKFPARPPHEPIARAVGPVPSSLFPQPLSADGLHDDHASGSRRARMR